MSEASLKIGVVGVGVMGTAIATRLLERGHELTVRDAAPARLAPLVARGARAADTGAELAREVDYVIASLTPPTSSSASSLGQTALPPAPDPASS